MFQKLKTLSKSVAYREFNAEFSRGCSTVGRTIFALSSGNSIRRVHLST